MGCLSRKLGALRLDQFTRFLARNTSRILYLVIAYLSFCLIVAGMQSLIAIADPTRRRIVELLAERERTAGELVEEFDMSAPAISQHLNVLRNAGLVFTRAQGQSRIQSLNPDGFDDLDAWLEKTRAIWSRRLDALERELRAEDKASAGKPKKKS